MERPLNIPREALDKLLRASGSALTPEAYLASLQEKVSLEKYPSRASASWWSVGVLGSAAVLSFLWIPLDFRGESIFLAVLILLFTVIEVRVHRGFKTFDPEAPTLGFRNQGAFALSILLYGIYHACAAFPPSIQTLIESLNSVDPSLPQMFRTIIRIGYLAIGVVGGVSQFGLAWYYLSARAR